MKPEGVSSNLTAWKQRLFRFTLPCDFIQRYFLFKGILGGVTVDTISHKRWKIVPFEFNRNFVDKLLKRSVYESRNYK